jgi:hypothetical protein
MLIDPAHTTICLMLCYCYAKNIYVALLMKLWEGGGLCFWYEPVYISEDDPNLLQLLFADDLVNAADTVLNLQR